MSQNHNLIREDDVRNIVRLLAHISGMDGNHAAKKTALLNGLCELIGADKWLWVLKVEDENGGTPSYSGYLKKGFTSDQLVSLTTAATLPELKRIEDELNNTMEQQQGQLTMRIEDFANEEVWRQSEASKLVEKAGVGTFMYSNHPLSKTVLSSVAVYREPGKPSFSAREKRITHIILEEVSWLHSTGLPEEYCVELMPSLPRAMMPLLLLLLQGHSRKESAQILNLSPHTVSSYIKSIYKHFKVNSQPMLMKRFIYYNGENTDFN